jgi:UDP-N-acetylglucosamine 4,6-dehydratase
MTDGAGSFSQVFVPMTLDKCNPKILFSYSRDEIKQWEMVRFTLKSWIAINREKIGRI